MTNYLYDGTSEGLVSAVAAIIGIDPAPETATLAERRDTLFEEGLFLRTEPEAVEALFSQFRKQAPDVVSTIWYFLMSDAGGLETNLLHYVVLALRHGDRVNGYLTHPDVKAVVARARKAGHELHRMKGLLRFEQMRDGAYLARMEPDHNLIHPLAKHFSRRLRDQRWFILDLRRHSAAFWDGHRLSFGTLEAFSRPELSDAEREVQELWRSFFRTVAIPERTNPRLQKSNMPAKYWKYLTEKQEL